MFCSCQLQSLCSQVLSDSLSVGCARAAAGDDRPSTCCSIRTTRSHVSLSHGNQHHTTWHNLLNRYFLVLGDDGLWSHSAVDCYILPVLVQSVLGWIHWWCFDDHLRQFIPWVDVLWTAQALLCSISAWRASSNVYVVHLECLPVWKLTGLYAFFSC